MTRYLPALVNIGGLFALVGAVVGLAVIAFLVHVLLGATVACLAVGAAGVAAMQWAPPATRQPSEVWTR